MTTIQPTASVRVRALTALRNWWTRTQDLAALAVFLLYASWQGPASRAEWLVGYAAAALVALGVWACRVRRGQFVDRVGIALALYFTTGALALVLPIDVVNTAYDQAQAAAMLAWVALVDLCCGLLRIPAIPPAVDVSARNRMRIGVMLALVDTVAMLLSFALLPHPLLSSLPPFLLVFAMRAGSPVSTWAARAGR